MGLKATGEAGAKAQLKSNCAKAFRVYESLLDARKGIGATRSQTAVLIDANVIMMSVPSSVNTLHGFVSVVWGFVEWAIGTGWLSILVFDEPSHMTNAKRLEQARRDAAKNTKLVPCSEDVDPFPFTDDYTRSDLESSFNVHSIRDKRPSRSRMYDEVAKRIFEMASAKAAAWNESGKPENRTVLLLDGVDVRGCDRPAFQPRNVGMVCNDADILAAFERETPIGEGDLKLQALEDRIRELAMPDNILAGTNLVMSSTIDTDSLMISALAVSKRRVNPFGASVHSVLCMRTRAANSDESATYLVVDVAMLEALMLQHVYGRSKVVSAEQALNTMLAIASSAALSGCDFCSLPGARFDHFFNSLGDFAKTEPLALQGFSNLLSNDSDVAKKACYGLIRVCYNASAYMETKGKRFEKQSRQVAEVDDDTLRRAAWTASYWCQNEFRADEGFGFPTPGRDRPVPVLMEMSSENL